MLWLSFTRIPLGLGWEPSGRGGVGKVGAEFEEQAGFWLLVLNTGSRGRESENRFECGHRSRHLWMGCAGQSDHMRTQKESSGRGGQLRVAGLMDENGAFMEMSWNCRRSRGVVREMMLRSWSRKHTQRWGYVQQDSAFMSGERWRLQGFTGHMEMGSAGEWMQGLWSRVVRGSPSLRDMEVLEPRNEPRKRRSGEPRQGVWDADYLCHVGERIKSHEDPPGLISCPCLALADSKRVLSHGLNFHVRGRAPMCFSLPEICLSPGTTWPLEFCLWQGKYCTLLFFLFQIQLGKSLTFIRSFHCNPVKSLPSLNRWGFKFNLTFYHICI